jgi:TRAP transporter TAXI family solute receptor
MNRYSLRPWLSWAVMLTAIFGVVWLGYQQTSQSNVLRLASGERGSYAYHVAADLKKRIEQYSSYNVELVPSLGSSDNRSLLQSDKADIGILAPANTEMANLVAIAPVSQQYLQVIVNADSKIDSILDLPGHRIGLGSEDSDQRKYALRLLQHYNIEPRTLRNAGLGYRDLLDGRQLDGAIITESLLDPFMRELIATGRFRLLPVEASDAMAAVMPYQNAVMLPPGSYPTVHGPMPALWLPTIVTENVLASRADLPDAMVEAVLAALVNNRARVDYPLINEWIDKYQGQFANLDVHEAVYRYFDPYGQIKAVAYVILLQAWYYKYWIICLVALAMTGWGRWQHFIARRVELDRLQRYKRIEKLLEDISNLEQQQADSKDYRILTRRLADARKIKQDGLKVATDLAMTDSQIFLLFMQECDHVIRDIQWKLSMGLGSHSMMVS